MKRVLFGLAALLACAGPVLAQGGPTFPTGIGNTRAPLVLQGCMDRRGYAVPCSLSDTVADVLHRGHSARPENRAQVVSISPNDACNAVPSAALASSVTLAVVQTAPLTLCSFNVAADSTLYAADWWIMIFDAASLPADGAVTPAKCYGIPAGTRGYNAGFSGGAIKFKTGIIIAVSTNGCFTKAASVHAFISGDFR
jgi:hypothetical protein